MSTTPIPLPQEADIAVPQKGTTVSETGTPDFGPIVGHFNVSSHVAGVKKAYDEIVQHARNARSSLAGKLNEAVIKHVPNFDTMPPEVQNDVRTAVSQGLGFYSGGLLESAPAMAPSDVEHPMTSTVPPVGGPKSIVEGEGLVYKGELSPGSDRHMVEHPNHPGKTATFEGPVTAEKARAEVNRKLNEFGVDPNVPETARQYIERSKGPVKDFSALPGHEERLSAEEQFKKEMFEDAKTSPDFRGLGPTGVGGLGANIEEPVAPGRATEGDKPAFYENKPLYEGPTGEKFDFGSLKEHQEIKPAKVKQAAVPPTVREGYYNTIEHVVQNKLGNSFTPEQLHATLKNAGVPKQEMENLGINDPEKLSYKLANRSGKLPSERDTLTKQEVLDHLDRNRLQLDVVEHAEGTVPPEYQKLKDEESQLLVDRQNLSHRIALANDELLSGELGHAAYQDKNNEFNELKQRQDKVLNRLGDVRNTMDNFKPQPGNVEHTKYGQYTLPGGTNYREVLLQKRGEEPESGEAYESPHFDEPNILAHLRLKDRVDTSGKKTLFMEEAQSDWAHDATPEAREQQRQDYAPEDYEEGSPHVPRFPLGSDWHELALKHALKEAVDGGYDQLSWTTGQQQAERYNLAKAVDHLIYDDKIEQLSGLKNGKLVVNDFVAPEDLHKYVGKDLAKQLTSTPITSEGEFGINRHNLHITETTIGGEKHKALYDRMIPQFLNKYTKRWGGKVGTTEIEVPEHNPTDPDDPWGGGNTNIVNPKSKVTVHTLPITPELREAVQKGQPMFGAGIKEPAPSRGPEEKKPEIKSRVSIPPETTTGKFDGMIKASGAVPGGITKGDDVEPDYVNFHDPTTGSTLALPKSEMTPGALKVELDRSRAQFEQAKKPDPYIERLNTGRFKGFNFASVGDPYLPKEVWNLGEGDLNSVLESTGKPHVEKLPINDLIVTQQEVGSKRVAAMKQEIGKKGSFDEPIHVIRYRGKNYVADGHHRLATLIKRGDKEVPASIYDVK